MSNLPSGLTEADVERAARAAYFAGEGIASSAFHPANDAHWAHRWQQDRNELEAVALAALTAAIGDRVVVAKQALDWLHGEGPDADGKWFGDCEQAKALFRGKPRPYWWRSKFRAMIAAAPGTKP